MNYDQQLWKEIHGAREDVAAIRGGLVTAGRVVSVLVVVLLAFIGWIAVQTVENKSAVDRHDRDLTRIQRAIERATER